MKILLLEDNTNLAEIIKEMLEEKGHRVDWFEDGEAALFASVNGYDCFVLDIHVASMDGIALLKEIRSRDKKTPTIIISANIELETIQKAYSSGCNDYLKKPFYVYELETKIDLLSPPSDAYLLPGGYVFSPRDEVLYAPDRQSVKLVLKERRFLSLLAKTPNVVVTNEAIEQYVWEGRDVSLTGLRSLVKRLRAKMDDKCIETQNYGYRLIVASC